MYVLRTMLFFTLPTDMLKALSYTVSLVLEYNSTKLYVPYICDTGIIYVYVT